MMKTADLLFLIIFLIFLAATATIYYFYKKRKKDYLWVGEGIDPFKKKTPFTQTKKQQTTPEKDFTPIWKESKFYKKTK